MVVWKYQDMNNSNSTLNEHNNLDKLRSTSALHNLI